MDQFTVWNVLRVFAPVLPVAIVLVLGSRS